MLESNCCDARPINDQVDEIDDMYLGFCSKCGEHAVFIDTEEWEDFLEKDKEQHGELWEQLR